MTSESTKHKEGSTDLDQVVSDTTPKFSVVIPARDESAFLPACLASIHASATARNFEVIVVINRCSDNTEEIARAAGCLIIREDARNLSAIRNAGANAAKGEILITLDADSRMAPNTFAAIESALEKRNAIGGAVPIFTERLSLGILLTGLCLLPLVAYYGISAGLFFCRRSDFKAIGGFDERFVSVEDIDFAKRLRSYGSSRGQHFAILWRSPITTSCRKFDRFGDWYFILHPLKSLSLLRGRNQEAANQVWYDFPRS